MTVNADSPETYLAQLPPEQREAVARLRDTVRANLPAGFAETMQYGMITYGVPHSLYPAGYRANPHDPLPFMSIAAQKRHIALYHLGLYAFPEVLTWFQAAYAQAGVGKLDMGKACIRFRNARRIPYALLAALCQKITVEAYVAQVERG